MNMVSCLLGLLLVVSVSVKDAKSEIRVPPTILSPREGQTLIYKQNEKVTVHCNATGTPKPKYKWKWNGLEINSQYIKYSETDGLLDIPSLSDRDEGLFVCLATSTFSNGEKAVAQSPQLEIRVARVGDFIKRPTEYYNVKEGMYIKLPCDKELPAYYGATTFKWYKTYDQKNTEIFMDARKFIDQEGSLHFSYAQTDDQSARDEKYKCAMSNVDSSVIKLGNENSLQVNSNGSSIPDSSPKVQYTTSGKLLTVEVGKNATLECVFSGYKAGGSNNKTVPVITWLDQHQQPIGDGGRYQITHEGRSLIIMNVTEEDEKTYHCQGTNSLGSAIGNLTLNVTSRPIWVQRVPSVTLTEGKDAVLTCVTRSASNEDKPNAPIWLRNGDSMTSTYDPSKYVFHPDKTILTIKHVKKDRDIACYQCEVANSVGMVQDDGCVNVVVPISIVFKPNEIQRVKKEVVVELTVVATTDPLYESEMRYSWIFKNVTYEGSNAPPNVTYDVLSKRAYINTSLLTDEELTNIVGIYRRVITTPVETKHVDVKVVSEVKKTEPVRVPPTILSPREGQTLIYKQNQKVTVYCNATGTPNPKYKWKWNGVEINSDYIKYNEKDGLLDIPSLSEREEGIFVCLATTTFSNGEKAVALSPLVEIRVAHVGEFIKRPTEHYNVKEGMYIKLPCDKELPAYYGETTFKWYKTYDQTNTEIFMDARKFIDQEGDDLYKFTYEHLDHVKTAYRLL